MINMRYVKRFAVTALMILCFACCFSACGGHYVSEKEMAKVEKQYEEGKISTAEYLETVDAYLANEPLPRKGIIGAVFGFFEKVFLFVVGVAVIGFIIMVLRGRK